jgi:hypothetical protein
VTNGLLDGVANVLATHSRDVLFGAAATAASAGAAPLAEGAGLVGRSLVSGLTTGAAGGATEAAAQATSPKNPSLSDATQAVGKATVQNGVTGVLAQPVAEGLVGGASWLMNKGGQLVNWAKEAISPASKLQVIKSLYDEIGSGLQRTGMALPTSAEDLGQNLAGEGDKITNTQAGAIRSLKKDLGEKVGAIVDDAEAARTSGSDDPIKLSQDQLSQMKGLLKRFQFGDGQLPAPAGGGLASTNAADEIGYEQLQNGEFAPKEANGKTITMPDAAISKGFYGSGIGSDAEAQKLMDFYNNILVKNKYSGFTIPELHDATQAAQSLGYDSSMSDKASGIFQKMSGVLGSERNGQIINALQSSSEPNAKVGLQAFQNYSDNIGYINKFLSAFDKTGSASAFASDIVQNKNGADLGKLKFLLGGDDAPLWQQVKGQWMQDMLTSNSSMNFLNAKGVLSDLNKYDQDVLGHMFDPQELTDLKKSLLKVNSISTSNFTGSPSAMSNIESTIHSVFGGAIPAGMMPKILFNSLKNNGPALDYMAGDGFLNLAKKADDPVDKQMLMQGRDYLKSMIAASEQVKNSATGYAYEPSTALKNALADVQNDKKSKAQPSKPNQPNNIGSLFQVGQR